MNYIIYGLGISGLATAKYLIAQDKNVIITDDNDAAIYAARGKLLGEIAQHQQALVKFLPAKEIEGECGGETTIVFAPGIPLYHPRRHKILDIVAKTGARLLCDVELFYLEKMGEGVAKRGRNSAENFSQVEKESGPTFLAITGTNGKSTTTALAGFVFEQLKLNAQIGGNIGVPCFKLPAADIYVFETSSYQIDLLEKAHFRVAALTNITPDHIDRHGSFAEYVAVKKKIFRNQIAGDFAVIGVDNEASHKIYDELRTDKSFEATLVAVSTQKIIEGGVSVIDGVLHNKIAGNDEALSLEGLVLKGGHNMQNIAVAFAEVYCYFLTQLTQLARPTAHKQNAALQNISSEEATLFEKQELGEELANKWLQASQFKNELAQFSQKTIVAIKQFKGLRHRMQFVGKINDINFINDSKATNAESTENALKSYENIFWILGGKPKEGGISSLEGYFNKISKAYLIGEASDEFAQVLQKNNIEFAKCRDLKTAFAQAFLDAKKSSLKEKNILLSPACASFDQWKNFEERGDYFCKAFDEINKS